jgi:drug/metabolite transporter (DMT)-like permease
VNRRSAVLFAAMCVIWGVPYLLIRVAVRDLSPADVVFARTAIGAALLLPIAARRGLIRQLRGYVGWLAIFTIVEMAIPWFLLTSAEQHVTSSLAGLLVAAVPLISLLLTWAIGSPEPVTRRRGAGLAVGIAGVAALVGLQVGHIDLVAVLEIFAVTVGYAAGPLVLARRLAGVPSLAIVSVSLAVTAVGYAPFALTERPSHVSGEVIWSVLGLAVVCTAIAFLVFFALIAELGPTRSTVITYVNPAVAIALGVTVLGEHLTTGMIVGFPLVLLGSVLATGGSATASSADEEHARDVAPAAVTPG